MGKHRIGSHEWMGAGVEFKTTVNVQELRLQEGVMVFALA